MAKILWISDAGRPTGFGTVTHALGERLAAMGHEIHVLAVGWDAAFPVEGPLKLYRAAARNEKAYLGYDRVVELLKRVEPDIVVVNEDPPMLMKRLLNNPYDPEKLLLKRQPVVAYLPIDGYGIPEEWKQLTQLVTVVPYTQFGADALGLEYWVHHGVDDAYHPLSAGERRQARRDFNIDDDAFVIGRVDTNSGRKDWGSTWKAITTAFDLGLKENKTVALFHTKLKEPQSGVDLNALISRGRGKFMVTNETGWPVEQLVRLINCFDVTLSTSRGEGWGLNLAQSLACGVPVVATDCSSIPEVVGPGGILIDGIATMTNPYGVDLVLADTKVMAEELAYLARSPRGRLASLATAGLEHVKQFDWDASAATFHTIIEGRLAHT